MTTPEPYVPITLSEIYREVRHIGETLSEVNNKVDQAISTNAKLEGRVAALERKVWTFSGGALVLGTLAEYLLSHVIK